MKLLQLVITVVISSIIFISCKKENETFQTAAIETYAPLQAGKFITYRLDSLVPISFGSAFITRSYEVKFVVDSPITDNTGRPAWRIFRYIKPIGSGSFTPDATFTAINSGTGLEFIENNLRYIKLLQPIREGYSWKGNRYIDTYSINSDVKYLDDWDYSYVNAHQPKTLGTFTFDSTVTVDQRNDSLGLPLTPQTQYAEKNVGKEIYAAHIGMVYRNFVHYEFQRVSNSYTGYGVTYTIIAHN